MLEMRRAPPTGLCGSALPRRSSSEHFASARIEGPARDHGPPLTWSPRSGPPDARCCAHLVYITEGRNRCPHLGQRSRQACNILDYAFLKVLFPAAERCDSTRPRCSRSLGSFTYVIILSPLESWCHPLGSRSFENDVDPFAL